MLVQRLIVVFTAFSALIKRSPEHRPPRSVLLYPCFAHPNFNTCSFSPSIHCIMHLCRFCFFGLCQQTTFNPVFTVIAKLTVKNAGCDGVSLMIHAHMRRPKITHDRDSDEIRHEVVPGFMLMLSITITHAFNDARFR